MVLINQLITKEPHLVAGSWWLMVVNDILREGYLVVDAA